MRFEGPAFRAHDPKWAFKPLSGDGAAIHGARFNPQGVPALYLALDPVGALVEASQGFPERLAPLTLCQYHIACDDILDLRTDADRAAAGTTLDILGCAWKDSRPAPSQVLARRLIAEGHAGIIVPSFALRAEPRHANIVLWTWGPDDPHRVAVYDPTGRLPQDQLSWPT